MSAIHEYRYQQQQRRREYLRRVRNKTSEFAERYQQVLQQLTSQQLDQYVPQEFASLQRQVNRLHSLLSTNPEEARELSMLLGDEVYGLRRLAQQARSQTQRQERIVAQQRWEREQERLRQVEQQRQQYWQKVMSEFSDPVLRDFALESLLELQQKSEFSKAELQQKVAFIKEQATIQAQEWKQKQQVKLQQEVQLEVIEEKQKQLTYDLAQSPKKLTAIVEQLEQLKKSLAQGKVVSKEALQQQLQNHVEEADEAITDERCRQLTVKGIMQSLQDQGFTLTQAPQLFKDGERDEVVITAKKLSGRESQFRVGLDGNFSYKFEHYEGQACKEDIEAILPKLQEIYGIELSEKKVLWENPDRELRSARSMDEPQQNDLER
ncbi:hypothetical protein [Vibrio rotiferianus]|uniref:hypothetical protein n=1 Tax=Vibrio rotiferianus TaxID=190895 RepID=UPI0038B39CC0